MYKILGIKTMDGNNGKEQKQPGEYLINNGVISYSSEKGNKQDFWNRLI